ncbi:MAG: type I pullulanase [Clostridiales bacterium]|nr:type I pullulanase [Clostridiales bacterium]
MKKLRHFGSVANAFKTAMMFVLIAAIVFVALPLGSFGRRSAPVPVAEESTPAPQPRAEEKASVQLTVYFYSLEYSVGSYPFNLWIWAFGQNGKRYDFDEDESLRGVTWKKVTATVENIDLSDPTADAIGVIYKHGTDADKEWGFQTANMMIPVSKVVGNQLTIYLVNGDEEIYYDVEEADLSTKFKEVKFNYLTNKYRVQFNTGAAKLTENTVLKILDSEEGEHGTLDCTTTAGATSVGKNTGYIDFVGEFDFGETYKLVDRSTDEQTRFASCTINKIPLYDNAVFTEAYNYTGTLGAEYSSSQTKFTVWAPTTKAVMLNIYEAGEGGAPTDQVPMTKGTKGEWTATITRDLDGKYYTYTVNGKEIVDPYARSAGRNGKRGMILNLAATNPEGWENHHRPNARGSYSNAIIYETHIRDITINPNSNVSEANRGKFLGLTESASAANDNKMTPLDYMKDLGITEVHILPMFDFATVDESFNTATYDGENEYNWGYDPLNYNVPEGSYSTNPADGAVRVNELKQMIMALHKADIRVIMDVVYNHVSSASDSNFEALVPGYYFRTNNDGSLKKASGCGNDTASERAMFRKFMVESVNYWAKEYKLDGFRFDLMGLHDTITMNEIYNTLARNNPDTDIMVYGEGWRMSSLVETSDMKAANMYNSSLMPNIAFFDDVTRDGIKGGGFNQPMTSRGFAQGSRNESSVYIGAVGGTANNDAGYRVLGQSAFATEPTQNISYVSCHDNSTLWDKINACSLSDNLADMKAMNRIAATAVMTSQGAVFMLAGEEMLRAKITTENNDYDNRPEKYLHEDKYFADNSYKSPDSVNAIDWSLVQTNADMVEFYKQLILLRKNSPMFRITKKADLDKCVKIVDANMSDGIASYAVKDPNSNQYAVLLYNNSNAEHVIDVPNGEYGVYVNGAQASGTTPLSMFSGDKFTVAPYSAVVMKGTLDEKQIKDWIQTVKPEAAKPASKTDNDDDGNLGLALGLGIGIPAVVLIAGGVVFGMMYGKKKKGGAKSQGDESAPDEPKAENAEGAESETPPEENATGTTETDQE